MLVTSGWLSAKQQGVVVWIAPSSERVFLTQKPDPGVPQEMAIHVCRNEVESVQVIASGEADDLVELSFEYNHATDARGNKLPLPVVYWEYDIPVRKSSPYAPLRAGLFPDALVPFQNKTKVQRAALRNTKGQVNFRMWADYQVPSTQQPGIYKGQCIAKNADTNQTIATVHIIIHVGQTVLPKRPALKSFFGINEHRVAELNQLDREDDGVALAHLMGDYYQLMQDCRVEPGLVYGTSAPITQEGQLRWKLPASPTLPSAKKIVHQYFSQGRFQNLHLPMWNDYPYEDPLGKDREDAVRYMAQLAQRCQQTAPSAQLFFSVGDLDEPDTAAAYQKIRNWASLIRDASMLSKVKIRYFVTEQPQPQKSEWGSLISSVDIWAPHVMGAWEDLESRAGKRVIAQRIAVGEEVWCYPALAQFGDTWIKEKGQLDTAKQSCPPVWLVDYPAVHFRILPWICARHDLTGIHYWDIFHWPPGVDPWKDAGTFIIGDGVFNGDGLLIYPPAPLSLQSSHPQKPCPSIRLKWIRDGMEDYDHLTVLRKTHPKQANEILTRIAKGFADWETSIPKINKARRAMSKAMQNSP